MQQQPPLQPQPVFNNMQQQPLQPMMPQGTGGIQSFAPSYLPQQPVQQQPPLQPQPVFSNMQQQPLQPMMPQGIGGIQSFAPSYLPQQPLPPPFNFAAGVSSLPPPQQPFYNYNSVPLTHQDSVAFPPSPPPSTFSASSSMSLMPYSTPTQFTSPLSPQGSTTPSPITLPPPIISSPSTPPGFASPSALYSPSGFHYVPPPEPIPLVFPMTTSPQTPSINAKKPRKKKDRWVESYIPSESDYAEAKRELEGDEETTTTSDGWIVTTGGSERDGKVAKRHCRWESHGYCRSYNLKFHPEVCKNAHRFCRAQGVKLSQPPLTALPPTSAEYDYFVNAFVNKWHGPKPTVKGFWRIDVPHLTALFDRRKQFIESLNGSATVMTLYHGTRESVLMDIYCNGFTLPADFRPDSNCKKSGTLSKDKASLCSIGCKHCGSKQHKWNKCHMFGLGVYFADHPSKSDIYVSDLNGQKTKTGRKMLICEVALGNAMKVKQLKQADEMHDLVLPPAGHHSIHAIGMGLTAHIPSAQGGQLAVKLDEYIVFHPHQALPRYLIEYNS